LVIEQLFSGVCAMWRFLGAEDWCDRENGEDV